MVPQMTDAAPLITLLKAGLADQYDIKVTAHSMLQKLCVVLPAAVVSDVEGLASPTCAAAHPVHWRMPFCVVVLIFLRLCGMMQVNPIEKTLTTRLKSEAVKQEVDRNEDLIRSALRAVAAVHSLPEAAHHPRFQTFMAKARAPASPGQKPCAMPAAAFCGV